MKLTVAVTGANGFIGRNLAVRLHELDFAVRQIVRETSPAEARAALGDADIVFHLAGANRPADPADFMRVNRDFTSWVADAVGAKPQLVICASSTKAADDSDYGRSKRAGEEALLQLGARGAATVAVCRLPNVFGKWARPNYNSMVATFCNNLARGLPIRIDDASAPITLLYIDDLIDAWCRLIAEPPQSSDYVAIPGSYDTTVGEVAATLSAFAEGRATGRVGETGAGLSRALYATYISSLPEEAFSYPIAAYNDARGSFAEVLRTPASGQVSYLTANPGETRGGHYHHSKVEKFLVVHGEARFRFRHIVTGAVHELRTSSARPVVVETIPGWSHDIKNVGEGVLVSLLWANELFDPERPDTVAMSL